ncbi:GAP family protein [Miniphocaeibacter halophilus]|uniref:GAP family protein n=1 Tax=Miniphocaeibacter halophilus TaxID=2931922 RepID=A0AC61MSP0_9FIRM|nr:GAP family protein [Miniphocaeibacter halophilus]QQK08507.1 GAP family protein [Miniphocaeibacter halophilus]
MFNLLIMTIMTGAADSINPIAITQQFVLQGMVKKAKHIWFFIVAIGLTNFAGGLLAYFGLISIISEFMKRLIHKFGTGIYVVELILGIIFLFATIYIIFKNRINKIKNTENSEGDSNEIAKKIKSVSPVSLLFLGIIATISELTTALPYFAFLTILFNYKLNILTILFILVLYNIIYSTPLIIMYFIYVKAQDKFDKMYIIIKEKMNKWAGILAPAATTIVGGLLIYHPLSLLL